MVRRLNVVDGPGPGAAWSGGAAQYWVERDVGNHLLVVAARCRLGDLEVDDLALLDTGAQWSVIGGELAELVREHAHDPGESFAISTRLGSFEGRLYRMRVTLIADDGSDLQVEATVLIAPAWHGPVVLGYRGLLERVRVALDPGVVEDDNWMYFGPVS